MARTASRNEKEAIVSFIEKNVDDFFDDDSEQDGGGNKLWYGYSLQDGRLTFLLPSGGKAVGWLGQQRVASRVTPARYLIHLYYSARLLHILIYM